MLTAVVGINWGDEGKGRMVDLFAQKADCVVRYQGGNNAGHTVVYKDEKYVLNLLPSGILAKNVVNVMGVGMVIDLKHLCGEIERLRSRGVHIDKDNLAISDKAVICMPYDVEQDCLEEDRLGARKFGSTRRGIGPVYGDKYMKKALRMGDLKDKDYLMSRLKDILEWKNLILGGGYGETEPFEECVRWLQEYGEPLTKYITDTGALLNKAAKEKKEILFEAQLGAMRDIDYGIYPFTSSSYTLAAYAPLGAGVPSLKLDSVVGIMKAYSTCVGEGPFVAEMFGEEGERLRSAGGEYGAATGRPRRVGGFDVVASRYGVRVQGASELALTKLDVLSGMDKIPVVTAYEINGKRTAEFPFGHELDAAKPVVEYVDGWKEDISSCRKMSELPLAAQNYVAYLQKAVDCRITFVSVGAERDQLIENKAD